MKTDRSRRFASQTPCFVKILLYLPMSTKETEPQMRWRVFPSTTAGHFIDKGSTELLQARTGHLSSKMWLVLTFGSLSVSLYI